MIQRRILFSAIAIAGLTACSNDATAPDAVASPKIGDVAFSASAVSSGTDTYLVRFKGNGIPAGFSTTVAGLGGEVIFAHAKVGIAAVSGLTESSASLLAGKSGIAAVDADAYTVVGEEYSAVESADAPQSPTNPTLAAFWVRQWNMNAIAAPAAWSAGKLGSSSVKVGIIDTGIDYLHPDLYGRVDLSLSRSFLSDAENARVPAGFNKIADLHYHGTHVAATVASNGLIAAGVTSRTTLVGLRVCNPGVAPLYQASCPTSGVLAAIAYAADNGIEIVNMSLGGAFNRRDASARGGFGPSFIATINQVMNYANRNGTTVVVSAGNDATDMDHDGNGFNAYCSASSVICVSATGPTGGTSYLNLFNPDAIAPYSNFGRSAVTVAAPGGSFVPVWAACSGFSLNPALASCATRFYNPTTGAWSGSALGISGTSMASPHVAGVAALIAANGGKGNIGSMIRQTADDLGQSGNDPLYGHGRVNAARASGAI